MYFEYLKDLIDYDESNRILVETLFNTIYIPNNSDDENRAYDGVYLRYEYTTDTNKPTPDLDECTMLEFFIGVAKRIAEFTYDRGDDINNKTVDIFWDIMDKIGIIDSDDEEHILEVLHDVTDGKKSIIDSEFDGSNVPIWVQINQYF
jgi:hypothetical protein